MAPAAHRWDMSEGKVAIVTVHGTGDTAESADGAKMVSARFAIQSAAAATTERPRH